MKITINDDGTYTAAAVSTADREFITAVTKADYVGKVFDYGGRSGDYTGPDFALFFYINDLRYTFHEEPCEKRVLGSMRDAIFYTNNPTVIAIDSHAMELQLGINSCNKCDTWIHGISDFCTSCIEECSHQMKRQELLIPNLGLTMAVSCTICGRIDDEDLERLQRMSQIERLFDVSNENPHVEIFVHPEGSSPEGAVNVRAIQEKLNEKGL